MAGTPVLQFIAAGKAFPGAGGTPRWALKPTSLDVERGTCTAIVGRSGSGKTTFLHLAAGIEAPTEGSVAVNGAPMSELGDRARTLLRREHIGLVFQFFHLISHLTVHENVLLPAMIAGAAAKQRSKANLLLDRVGLLDRAGDPVDHLSGGEMQRVAICRALLMDPSLLLADEPTGNLDDDTGRLVMDLMLELTRERGLSLVYVTHSDELAGQADRVVKLKSGRVT